VPIDDGLYLAANLALFAAVLLGWSAPYRPRVLARRLPQIPLILFAFMQALALSYRIVAQGTTAFTSARMGLMTAVETVAVISLLWRRRVGTDGESSTSLSLAFLLQSYVLLRMPSVAAQTTATPALGNVWYDAYAIAAAVSCGSLLCAAGAQIAWVASRVASRLKPANREKQRIAVPLSSRNALLLAYPVVTGSLIIHGIWSYLALGSYWSWRSTSIYLVALWLVLTITLHTPLEARWYGLLRTLLVFLGLILALLVVAGLGQNSTPA
jgi:ABC-type transport system involved in cytochrome c biogenesis permease subunit